MTSSASGLTPQDLRRAIQAAVRVVADFPSPGVNFRDISAVWERQPHLFRFLVDELARPHLHSPPDIVVSIESLGHLFGAPVAYLLRCPLVLARRAGKLAGATHRTSYAMSYGNNKELEIHTDAIQPHQRVLIVDDVLASGGTAAAAASLVYTAGAVCIGVGCAVEIGYPGARSLLRQAGMDLPVHPVVQV